MVIELNETQRQNPHLYGHLISNNRGNDFSPVLSFGETPESSI